MDKNYLYIGGVVVVLAVIVGGFFLLNNYIYQEKQADLILSQFVELFQQELVSRGVENVGQPIEGFDAFLLLQAFPGLQEQDFHGVLSFEGKYMYENGQLAYERTAGMPVTSAEQTVSRQGYEILLQNLSQRFGVNVQDKQAVLDLVDTLEGMPITVRGEITCLPKKGSGPQTAECAIGLKGQDGKHYALKNLFEHDPEYRFSTTFLQVEVTGIFTAQEVSGPGNSTYDVIGNISITSIKEDSEGQEITMREGQRESSFLLQNIYPDRVEGLNYWEYPVATDQGHPVTLRVGEVVSNGCTVQLTLLRIEGATAVFEKKVDFNRPCPICLAKDTLIDTPSGKVAVQNLQKGDAVWTVNSEGERVAGVVLEAAKTSVPATHQMVHVVLQDGRELFVSPGHPTADGRTVGELTVGDVLDGHKVTNVTLILYGEDYTYDMLPSGPTGFYWANGILLGSTLR